MTDPWLSAAQRLRQERTEAEQAQTLATRQENDRRAAETAEADRRYQNMEAAIAYAVPLLERFIRERGRAAQELLAAYSDTAHIMFGEEHGGGSYHSVYFDRGGVREEGGTYGGYGGNRTTPQTPTTVRKAVEYFAYKGAGRGKPDKVRNITAWFEESVNSYAKRD